MRGRLRRGMNGEDASQQEDQLRAKAKELADRYASHRGRDGG
jgi:hypothetical protein